MVVFYVPSEHISNDRLGYEVVVMKVDVGVVFEF